MRQIINRMREKLLECGLSSRLSTDYARRFYYIQLDEMEDQWPSEDCFHTLKKVLNPLSEEQRDSFTLFQIEMLLKIPYTRVAAAKECIGTYMGWDSATVEESYQQDKEWYRVTKEQTEEFFAYLSTRFSDMELCRKIYMQAALLGLEQSQERIEAVFDLLGEQVSTTLICEQTNSKERYFFDRFYSDPIGCLSYMKNDKQLDPEMILHIVRKEPMLLYIYKRVKTESNGHDQAWIDHVIDIMKEECVE